MIIRSPFRFPLSILIILIGCCAIDLLAQYQVNPMVNNRVNTGLYGTGTSGSVRYAGIDPQIRARTSQPMQSEIRYAYWKSGATPSDYRMGYAALGPMIEGGPISYLNYKPAYLSPKPAPAVTPMGSAAYTPMGSVRYASAAPPSSSMVSSAKLDALLGAPRPASPSLTNTVIPTSARTGSPGSISYSY